MTLLLSMIMNLYRFWGWHIQLLAKQIFLIRNHKATFNPVNSSTMALKTEKLFVNYKLEERVGLELCRLHRLFDPFYHLNWRGWIKETPYLTPGAEPIREVLLTDWKYTPSNPVWVQNLEEQIVRSFRYKILLNSIFVWICLNQLGSNRILTYDVFHF